MSSSTHNMQPATQSATHSSAQPATNIQPATQTTTQAGEHAVPTHNASSGNAQNADANQVPHTGTQSSSAAPAPPAGDEELPEQLHAGAVGYGPNYHRGPTLEDKMMGIKEEIKGKLTRNPERVQHGREIKSGEEKRKQMTGEDEPNPFSTADEDKDSKKPGDPSKNDATTQSGEKLQLGKSTTTASSTNNSSATGTGNFPSVKSTHKGHLRPDHGNAPDPRAQAAVVAPEGTHAAHRQKTEGGEGMMKHFGYDSPADTGNAADREGLAAGQERERKSHPMMKN